MSLAKQIFFNIITLLCSDASPGSQLVSEEFKVNWNWYLASSKVIIVAEVDARGSGYQGELLRSQIKGKLGTLEVDDQLAIIT